MTLQELSVNFRFRDQLEKCYVMLASFQDAASPGAQVLTGMPHASGIHDKVGDLAIEIADMKERIRFLEGEIQKEEAKIVVFIREIENDQTRMIFRLRFLRCLTWGQVAAVVGGGNTEASVKNICYRYLETCDGMMRDDAIRAAPHSV